MYIATAFKISVKNKCDNLWQNVALCYNIFLRKIDLTCVKLHIGDFFFGVFSNVSAAFERFPEDLKISNANEVRKLQYQGHPSGQQLSFGWANGCQNTNPITWV